MKPRKQLGVTRLLLRRFGLWVIDGRSPTGTTRWNSPRWGDSAGQALSSPATRGIGTGRSAGSAFEPERSRGTLGSTPARSVP